MNIVLIVGALAAVVALSRDRDGSLRHWIRRTWPLWGLCLVDAIVRVVTALRLSPNFTINMQYLFYSLLPLFALLSSLVIGASVARRAPRLIALLYCLVVGVSLFAASMEALDAIGAANPIAQGLRQWDQHVMVQGRVWIRAAGEPFRAMGFETDPNFLGALGLGTLVWALTARGQQRVRFAVGLGSAAIILLSASRTAALAAVLCACAVAIYQWMARRRQGDELSARHPALIPVIIAVSVVLVVASLSVFGQRVTETVQAANDVVSSGQPLEAFDRLTNGRLVRWEQALVVVRQYPLGAFMLPDVVVGTNIHNEYIERLVWGGPLMLLALLFTLYWLAVKFRPKSWPSYGLAAAIAWAVIALSLYATHLPAFATLLFFGVGAAVGHEHAMLGESKKAGR